MVTNELAALSETLWEDDEILLCAHPLVLENDAEYSQLEYGKVMQISDTATSDYSMHKELEASFLIAAAH